jgi:hypothetical protein
LAVLRFLVPLRFAVLRFFVPLRLAVLRFLVPLRFAVLRLAVLRLAVLRFFDELRFFAAPVFLRVAVVFFRDVPDRFALVRREAVERFAVDRLAPPDLLLVLELLLAINVLLFGVADHRRLHGACAPPAVHEANARIGRFSFGA